MDRADPIMTKSKRDIAEPNRATLLSESEEPNWEKSITDNADPNRA
jgi:hypothetical protein